jgi:AraC-like DNA-binding protein
MFHIWLSIMTFGLIDLIGLFTFIQLIFLMFVTFNYKKGKQLSNRILACFMASNALLIVNFLMSRFGWISPNKNLLLFSFTNSTYMLLTPFLYLYIRSLCYEDFQFKNKYLLHFIPFIIMSLFLIVIYRIVADTDKGGPMLQGMIKINYSLYKILLHVQIASYLIASARMLAIYRERIKDIYSSIEKIDLSWCNLLLLGFAVMWITDILNWMLFSLLVITPSGRNIFLIVSLLINLIFTLAVVYRGLIRAEGFSGIRTPVKYAAYLMKPDEGEAIIQKLLGYMEKEKIYLVPSLTIDEFSKRLNVPAKKISQAIHTHLNNNFYEFINSYRINEAKERMLDIHYKNQKLLSVAFDSGFNSKSVFNAAFKKHTGMTPKEFKRLHSS